MDIPAVHRHDGEEARPGFLEVDLVAHCGESSEGFYLTTLCAVDVASGWSECLGVWGKGQERVGGAVHRVRSRLPFPLLGLDSDNSSEFINQHLYTSCQREGITFTPPRGCPAPTRRTLAAMWSRKPVLERSEGNWSIVRRLVGYDRYSSHAALETLNHVHDLLRLYINFFQPVMKLVAKTRHGARVHKVYDRARTPYQRLLKADVLTEAKGQQLAATYHGLNPVLLLRQINENLERL